MTKKRDVDRSEIVKDELIPLKDIFTIYENGKGRRYGLLFSVHAAAFAILSFLIKDGNLIKEASNHAIGKWTVFAVAAGMIFFTLTMWWDIYKFGDNMGYLSGLLGLFGPVGRRVLHLLSILLIAAWVGAAWLAIILINKA